MLTPTFTWDMMMTGIMLRRRTTGQIVLVIVTQVTNISQITLGGVFAIKFSLVGQLTRAGTVSNFPLN